MIINQIEPLSDVGLLWDWQNPEFFHQIETLSGHPLSGLDCIIFPNCPANSASFQSAKAVHGRQQSNQISSQPNPGLRRDAPPCTVGYRAAVVVLYPHDGRGNFEGAFHCKRKIFLWKPRPHIFLHSIRFFFPRKVA